MYALRRGGRVKGGLRFRIRLSQAVRTTRAAMAVLAPSVLLFLLLGSQPARAEAPPAGEGESAQASRGSQAPAVVSLRDTVIAAGARLLVETAVEHVELDELKKNAIEKIRGREEAEYRRQVQKIFDDLESVDVDELLGVTRKSSREEVIAILQRTDKAALRAAMRAIPDTSIVKLIERKLGEQGASSLSDAHNYLKTEIEEFVSEFSG